MSRNLYLCEQFHIFVSLSHSFRVTSSITNYILIVDSNRLEWLVFLSRFAHPIDLKDFLSISGI